MKITLTLGNDGAPFFRIDSKLVESKEGIKAIRVKYEHENTKKLAKICGVSWRTVQNWEQGRIPSERAMMLLKAWLKENEMFE